MTNAEPYVNPYRHDHEPLNADFHGGICPACEWEHDRRTFTAATAHMLDRYLVTDDVTEACGLSLVCITCLEADGTEFVQAWDVWLDGAPSIGDLTRAVLEHEVATHHAGSPL